MPDISDQNSNSDQKPNPENKAQVSDKVKRRALYLKSLNLAIEFGFIVVVPLLLFGFIGKYLDNRYHTNKLFLLFGVVLALITTCVWFARRIKEIMKDMDNTDNSDNTKNY